MKKYNSLIISGFAGLLFACALHLSAQPNASQLNINNIDARINSHGGLFWDLTGNKGFEVPAGSGRHSIYASTLWIGGFDPSGQLTLSGETYGVSGPDFMAGPICDPAHYQSNAVLWDRVWRITRNEIDLHRANYGQPGYVAPADLLSWPGNGDVSKGEAAILAPFRDVNGDGIYQPMSGDYPIIRGDLAIYSIFNDAAVANPGTGGQPLSVEVHQMAYAFDCNDPAEANTIYLNYRLINRSATNYTDTYLGMWTDFDVGGPQDDYVGCDVGRGAYFAYNGDDFDENSTGSLGYLDYPPVQGVMVLGGPMRDMDGTDNSVATSEPGSVNGIGYGDGITDNERLGMSNFMYYTNAPLFDPSTAADFYNYLRSIWPNGQLLTHGDNGSLGSNLPTQYAFPGNSNPDGHGHFGIVQPAWTMGGEGLLGNDVRGLGSCGPFTFEAGSEEEFDLAFVYARDPQQTGALAALPLFESYLDDVKANYAMRQSACGTALATSIIAVEPTLAGVEVFPNPSRGWVTVDRSESPSPLQYELVDATGRTVKQGTVSGTSQQLDFSQFSAGWYLIRFQTEESFQSMPLLLQP